MVDHSVVTFDGLEDVLVAKGDGILREVEVGILEAGSIGSLLRTGEFASVSSIRQYYYRYYYYYYYYYYYCYVVLVSNSGR